MKITDMKCSDNNYIRQSAILLVDGFKDLSPNAWPDMDAALKEVRQSFQQDRISCIAVGDNGLVLGWIGGIRQYEGHAWELHPLVVRQDSRKMGIGKVLVNALEERVKQRGGLTLYLGTDDENNATSLSGVDLYTNTWDCIRNVRNFRNHPYEFYQKVGFTIVGVIPDANGIGKPDIYMAKKIKY